MCDSKSKIEVWVKKWFDDRDHKQLLDQLTAPSLGI